jgi:hypothetical protein
MAIERFSEFTRTHSWFKLIDKIKYISIRIILERYISVIGLDMPIHLILYGRDNNGGIYYQVTHSGRHNMIIYIPKKLSESFKDTDQDLRELGTLIYHDTQEIIHYQLLLKLSFIFPWLKKRLSSYEEEERIHKKALADDPLKGYPGLQKRVKGLLIPEEETAKLIRQEKKKAQEQITNITNEYQQKKLQGASSYELREYLNELGELYGLTGHLNVISDNWKEALKCYKKSRKFFREEMKIDRAGLLIITTQEKIITYAAQKGLAGIIVKELKNFIQGKFARRLRKGERDLLLQYLKSFRVIKKDVLRELKRHLDLEQTPKKKAELEWAIREISKLEDPLHPSLKTRVTKFIQKISSDKEGTSSPLATHLFSPPMTSLGCIVQFKGRQYTIHYARDLGVLRKSSFSPGETVHPISKIYAPVPGLRHGGILEKGIPFRDG